MAKNSGGNDTRADFAVKLVLMFFVSILSFSIGTYLGKQVSDADHRQASLEAEYSGEKVATHGEETYEDEAVAPVEDEVVAKLTEEAISAGRKVASEDAHAEPAHGDDHAAPASDTPAQPNEEGYVLHSKSSAAAREEYAENHDALEAKPAPATDAKPLGVEPKTPTAAAKPHDRHAASTATTATEKKVEEVMNNAGERVASGLSPSADPKKVTPPSTQLPTVATSAVGKYTVQVASYATTEEAESYAGKLRAKGLTAFVVPAEVGGKTWYRVSLGKFADQNSAKAYLTELKASQTVTSAIVQKLVQ